MKRLTRQRQAILACFENSQRPLSVDEILETASLQVPQLNLATVYRNLKMLMDQEMIAAVEAPGMTMRYERTGLHHHHHFLCRHCNKMFDVEGCLNNLSHLVPKGFELISHEITLTGYCSDCRGII